MAYLKIHCCNYNDSDAAVAVAADDDDNEGVDNGENRIKEGLDG